MKASKLFVFEGANEVGKSSLATMLAGSFQRKGIRCELIAFPGNEPGTLGYHVYKLHHHAKDFGISHLDQTSLQLLHVVAHVDAIRTKILSALKRGHIVVLDRFWWSTLVYGRANGADLKVLKMALALEQIAWGRVRPTRMFLVTRSSPLVPQSPTRDWDGIAAAYRRLAAQQRRHVPVTLIANESDVQVAFDAVTAAINSA